jgi:hypothetical protein
MVDVKARLLLAFATDSCTGADKRSLPCRQLLMALSTRARLVPSASAQMGQGTLRRRHLAARMLRTRLGRRLRQQAQPRLRSSDLVSMPPRCAKPRWAAKLASTR